MTVAGLNALPPAEAERALLACCGSRAWARRMAALRPFASAEEVREAAERVWWRLGPEDWREAFRSHPRIGERTGAQPARGARWSAEEQAGVGGAEEAVRAALTEGNRAYEARFGHIYIVCATGKGADEMLEILRARLDHDPDTELRVAAGEQARITHLRIDRLLSP